MDLLRTGRGKSIETTSTLTREDNPMQAIAILLEEATTHLNELVKEYQAKLDSIPNRKELYSIVVELDSYKRRMYSATGMPELRTLQEETDKLEKEHTRLVNEYYVHIVNDEKDLHCSFANKIRDAKQRTDRLRTELMFLIRREEDAILAEASEKLAKLRKECPTPRYESYVPEEFTSPSHEETVNDTDEDHYECCSGWGRTRRTALRYL